MVEVVDGWVDGRVVGLSKTNVNLWVWGGGQTTLVYYRGTDNLSMYFRGGGGRKTLINTLKEGRTISI